MLNLLIGLGLGYLLFSDEKDKEKVIDMTKRTLYRWQTGKELPKPEPVTYKPIKISYRNYFNNKKAEEKKNVNSEYAFRVPTFDSKEKAMETLDFLDDMTKNFKTVSVLQLMYYLGHSRSLPFSWDNFGWTAEDIGKAYVDDCISNGPLNQCWTIRGLDFPREI